MRLTYSVSNCFKLFEFNRIYLKHKITRWNTPNSVHALSKIDVISDIGGIRHLYSPASLGINTFMQRRNKCENKYISKETFFNQMSNLCQKKESKFYTEDLRNMIYLCERNKHDLEMLQKMIKTYYAAEKGKSSFDINLSAEYMKLCFHLNLPNEARMVLNDENISGFFNTITSYVVAMSLFYNSGLHEEVIKTMNKSVSEKIFRRNFPRPLLKIVLASCYQLNTHHSLDAALSYINQEELDNIRIDASMLAFASALALKQNNPIVALELSSKTPWNYYMLKNIMVEALVMVGRAEDALLILKGYSGGYKHISHSEGIDNAVFLKTLNIVEKALIKENNADVLSEFNNVKKMLEEESLISNMSLEEALCEPLTFEGREEREAYRGIGAERKKRDLFAASFERGKQKEKFEKSFQRTGFKGIK